MTKSHPALKRTRAEKKFQMFEPLFVCCEFEAKFSLRTFAAMPTVCACALVHSKRVVNNMGVFQ